VRDAWTALYQLVSTTMKAAANTKASRPEPVLTP